MTVYHLVEGAHLAELNGQFMVKATDLRELLLHWGAELKRGCGLTVREVAIGKVADDMRTERLSLHCEPEVPKRVCYQGKDIDEMSESEAKEALVSMAGRFR